MQNALEQASSQSSLLSALITLILAAASGAIGLLARIIHE
jgi:hypothetical protein